MWNSLSKKYYEKFIRIQNSMEVFFHLIQRLFVFIVKIESVVHQLAWLEVEIILQGQL